MIALLNSTTAAEFGLLRTMALLVAGTLGPLVLFFVSAAVIAFFQRGQH